MSSILISASDSRQFAVLSGDFNRQHIDPVGARRLPFGSTVVHGVHTLLRALDEFASRRDSRFVITKIRASFSNPIRQGQLATVSVNDACSKASIVVKCGDILACSISLELRDGEHQSSIVPIFSFEPSHPLDLSEQQLSGAMGETELVINPSICRDLFPQVMRLISLDQIAALLAATRVVGMMCPGEHSIFKFLSLSFSAAISRLEYRVERFDPSSRLCSIALGGQGGLVGTAHAVFRAKPIIQPSYSEVSRQVGRNSFAEKTVLVVGGSRGLGEVAAKIAAAGGARVIVGYSSGEQDALRVSSEIVSGGGKASILHIDVKYGISSISKFSHHITDIYYFASPRIEFNSGNLIDRSLLNKFFDFYVFGIETLLVQIVTKQQTCSGSLRVFAPSSEFVGTVEHGAFEYAAAKAVAEAYSRYCTTKLKFRIEFSSPRLPQMSTDQTAGVQVSLPDPIGILLNSLSAENV